MIGRTFPHVSLRVRWGWVAAAGAATLALSPTDGPALTVALGFAWLLWRGDRDAGRH
ncbi:hypothetical protein SCMU_14220 [Sinomonas cyclohexanicum]|uniref:Uncharacterized protein n=1 Tax=Sinomonas cyclohexanicum TaxID=322009 RepID=A0ABM7PTK6_SINCY|nr:hypothetical protein [Corynebacterium cyclohexanicum]BCT75580.1 hypothetical protein SCMU_14220 [Corynebacterium cyclohexanicum]